MDNMTKTINVFENVLKFKTHYSKKEVSKGPLLGLRQFLTIGNPLKMIKNAFYFMLKALFVPEIFSFLS